MRSGPGAARTILLFHTISARPPKQPRMVSTFLKVHTLRGLGWRMHYGVEVTESTTNKQHHLSGDHNAFADCNFVWTCHLRSPPDIIRRSTSFGRSHHLEGLLTHHLTDLYQFCVLSRSRTLLSLPFERSMFSHTVSITWERT